MDDDYTPGGYTVKCDVVDLTRTLMAAERYVPAAGRGRLTPLSDPVTAVTTRAQHRRGRLVEEALLDDPTTIFDVRCGTGTLAVLLAATRKS